MSSFNRRSILILPLALAACGFAPVYGPNGPARGLQGKIRVADPADKNAVNQRLDECDHRDSPYLTSLPCHTGGALAASGG